MNEERLIEIETKIAHQEVLIAELNQVISSQAVTIDSMQSAMKSFFNRFREVNGDGPVGPADQKPPHY